MLMYSLCKVCCSLVFSFKVKMAEQKTCLFGLDVTTQSALQLYTMWQSASERVVSSFHKTKTWDGTTSSTCLHNLGYFWSRRTSFGLSRCCIFTCLRFTVTPFTNVCGPIRPSGAPRSNVKNSFFSLFVFFLFPDRRQCEDLPLMPFRLPLNLFPQCN